VFCPKCGFKNDDGAVRCARCAGALLGAADESQTTVSYPPPADEGVAAEPELRAGAGAALMIRVGGGLAGQVYELGEVRLTIGRHVKADVFLDDVTVSRHHAYVECSGERYEIVDENSLNGTYVNGRRSDRTVLAGGDEIQIGKYKLTFLTP
jgi:hypothetical protein